MKEREDNSTTLKKGIAIMVLSSCMTCTGQLMWKLASISEHSLLFLMIGFLLYGMGAVCMILAFRFGEMSVLQPMLSIGFVVSVFLGMAVLGEQITVNKCIGICLIVFGMIFLGRSGKNKESGT